MPWLLHAPTFALLAVLLGWWIGRRRERRKHEGTRLALRAVAEQLHTDADKLSTAIRKFRGSG